MDDDITADRAIPVDGLFDQLMPAPTSQAAQPMRLPGEPIVSIPVRILRSCWRYRAWILSAGIVALFAFLLANISNAERARALAAEAAESSRRAAAMNAFVADIFRQADPAIAAADAPREASATRMLDLATPKVGQSFAGDLPAQLHLLGVIADMHRALGNMTRYQSLRLQQAQMVLGHRAELDKGFLQTLISDSRDASAQQLPGAALGYLNLADQMITQAELDSSDARALWWLAYADAQRASNVAPIQEVLALQHAAQIFGQFAPDHIAYVEVLNRLAQLQIQDRPDWAADQFLQASQIAREHTGSEALLRETIYPGLGKAQENQGLYEPALASFQLGAAMLPELDGQSPASDVRVQLMYAAALHRNGDASNAHRLFTALMNWGETREKALAPESDAGLIESIRRAYAGALISEGRPQLAVSQLEAYVRGGSPADPRTSLMLTKAYLDLGAIGPAQAMLAPMVRSRKQSADSEQPARNFSTLELSDQWARVLLTGRNADLAEPEFAAILEQVNGRPLMAAVKAREGLALLAQRHGDWEQMLAHSTRAVVSYENIKGRRDLRLGGQLWVLHARALRFCGDAVSARIWADRALGLARQLGPTGAALQAMAQEELDASAAPDAAAA